jgi:hypothetical protein
MKRNGYKVRNIRFAKSNLSGLFFRVGTVCIKGQSITVFDGDGMGQWLTASPNQF